MAVFHSLSDILGVAKAHPFYTSSVRYPPSPEEIVIALRTQDGQEKYQLSAQPLLHKNQLYKTIERLYADESPGNNYRLSSYISITGGGSGKGLPMIFLTDVDENQQQRLATSQLMRACKVVEPSDWVLNIHPGGFLYRALDLTAQIVEQAGGSILNAGHLMPHGKSLAACIKYRVNTITGDSAHVLNFAHYVNSVPSSARSGLQVDKIIYTSEPLTRSKRRYLTSVFGPISLYSIFGAAETGTWAVANHDITRDLDRDNATDFLYDTRAMKTEVLSSDSSALTSNSGEPPGDQEFVSEGTTGHLVLTSLQRLKNPLVRYISGDVGSVHPLPTSAVSQIDPKVGDYLKVLRLYGRDQRFSFKWLSEYYEFDKIASIMQTEEWGILDWQIIVEHGTQWEGSDTLTLRLRRFEDEKTLSKDELIGCIGEAFYLTELTKELCHIIFVDDLQDFEQSETSTKVIRFIDKRGKEQAPHGAKKPKL